MDIRLNLNNEHVDRAKADRMFIVKSGTSISEVLHTLRDRNGGSVMVCDEDNKLIGIFTERDALKLLAHDADLDSPIDSVMIKNPATLHQTASIAEAIKRMSQGGYRRMPIVDDDGHLAGIVKVTGIVMYFVEHFPETVFNLPPEPKVIMPEREGA